MRFAQHHAAVQIVTMVVAVVIDGQTLGVFAKHFDKCRIVADLLGVARTAHMAIQANHLIGGTHHQMQVVGDHQHAAAVAVAQPGNQAVQLGLAADIHALYRFIEHQQLRFTQQRTGQ